MASMSSLSTQTNLRRRMKIERDKKNLLINDGIEEPTRVKSILKSSSHASLMDDKKGDAITSTTRSLYLNIDDSSSEYITSTHGELQIDAHETSLDVHTNTVADTSPVGSSRRRVAFRNDVTVTLIRGRSEEMDNTAKNSHELDDFFQSIDDITSSYEQQENSYNEKPFVDRKSCFPQQKTVKDAVAIEKDMTTGHKRKLDIEDVDSELDEPFDTMNAWEQAGYEARLARLLLLRSREGVSETDGVDLNTIEYMPSFTLTNSVETKTSDGDPIDISKSSLKNMIRRKYTKTKSNKYSDADDSFWNTDIL